jgi:thiol:disulfide interchange protein DsbD
MRRIPLLLAAALLTGLGVQFLPDLLGAGLGGGLGLETGDLASGTALGGLAFAYLGGVLTSLTPCVYPLIPITISIFGARQAENRWKGFLLVSAYVLGIAAMFSGMGLAAATSGAAFGTILSNRWVLVGLALFFVAMAASMFGAFELALPQGLAQRLNRVGGTGYGGAFAMGLVAGIVAAPCTGPVLASLLTFVATSGQPAFGVTLLFTYALGIGLPFFLIGVFSVSLPKSGPWMEGVKSIFGIALLVLALSYLKDALPSSMKEGFSALAPFVVLGSGLAALGVLLGAVHRSFHDGLEARVWKGLGVALVVGGIFVRVAAPHAAIAAGAGPKWITSHEEGLALARAEGKPVMIDFFADWCAACKELDKFTYVDPAVLAETDRFVNIKIDGTVEDDRIQALYKTYGVQGLPTVVFLDSSGKQLSEPRVTGFVAAPQFLELLKKVK